MVKFANFFAAWWHQRRTTREIGALGYLVSGAAEREPNNWRNILTMEENFVGELPFHFW